MIKGTNGLSKGGAMERKLNAKEITNKLQNITDKIRQRYFTGSVLGLDFVRVKVGKLKSSTTTTNSRLAVGTEVKGGKQKSSTAEYNLKRQLIKFSYKWVSSKVIRRRLETSDLEVYQEKLGLLEEVIFHELMHCLVHRERSQFKREGHSKWDEREGHSNWFLFYTHQLRLEHGVQLNLSGIHDKWRETEQISADIEQGYHPSQDWNEWRKKKAEAELRLIAHEVDSMSPADKPTLLHASDEVWSSDLPEWLKFVEEMKSQYDSLLNYERMETCLSLARLREIVETLKTYIPLDELLEIIKIVHCKYYFEAMAELAERIPLDRISEINRTLDCPSYSGTHAYENDDDEICCAPGDGPLPQCWSYNCLYDYLT